MHCFDQNKSGTSLVRRYEHDVYFSPLQREIKSLSARLLTSRSHPLRGPDDLDIVVGQDIHQDLKLEQVHVCLSNFFISAYCVVEISDDF